MLRQRITLFNPLDSNDNIISDATSSGISIKPPVPFEREDKFTLEDVDLKFNHVGKLRIQVIKEDTNSQVFNNYYSKGVSIYTSPRNITKAEDIASYFEEVNGFINKLFNLELGHNSWIGSHISLNYHTTNYTDGFTKYVNNELKFAEIPDSKSIDWFFDGEKIVVKTISTLEDDIVISKDKNINKEVGLFIRDKSISTNDDLVLSGLRALFKNDTGDEFLFKTLFHVKPRHRQLNLKYSSEVLKNGLHPILQSKFNDSIALPEDSDLKECRLYYYLKLDKSLFLDKYQLDENQNLLFRVGPSDLELPEYGIPGWGSEILIELDGVTDTVDLNLHSRYQLLNDKGYKKIPINDAQIFIGCDVSEAELLENSPFESRQVIGGDYERFFTNDSVFYHFQSESKPLYIDIPNGSSDASKVNTITLILLLLGLFLIGFKLLKPFKKATASTSKKND